MPTDDEIQKAIRERAKQQKRTVDEQRRKRDREAFEAEQRRKREQGKK